MNKRLFANHHQTDKFYKLIITKLIKCMSYVNVQSELIFDKIFIT